MWNDLSQANLSGSEFIHWINFETDLKIQGVRLYGSDLLGNNPVRVGGGLIVDDIFAYAGIPEPSTVVIAGMGAIALLRRRARRQ